MTEEARNRGMEYYEKIRDTPPKPAVELTGDDAEAVVQMLRDMGHKPAPGHNTIFLKDGTRYSILQDGRVTANEDGVATSLEDRKETMAGIEEIMGFQNGVMVDLAPQREALNAQLEALLN